MENHSCDEQAFKLRGLPSDAQWAALCINNLVGNHPHNHTKHVKGCSMCLIVLEDWWEWAGTTTWPKEPVAAARNRTHPTFGQSPSSPLLEMQWWWHFNLIIWFLGDKYCWVSSGVILTTCFFTFSSVIMSDILMKCNHMVDAPLAPPPTCTVGPQMDPDEPLNSWCPSNCGRCFRLCK